MIVTGASSGIGRALGRQAAREGWQVLLVARRAERLEELAREIRADGGIAEAVVADVCDPRSAQRIVDAAIRSFGRIDVVVNNAGYGAQGPLLDQSEDAIDVQWQLHVAAPVRIARAALPSLRATRGGIVFVGSGLARVPTPYYGAYCAAKAANRAAATQIRRELRRDGIAVTYVDPGAVDTEFSEASGKRRERDSIAVKPERVARAMLRGINRRARVVNAVPSHALGALLGEWFSFITDAAMDRVVAIPHVAEPELRPAPQPGPAPDPMPSGESLESALSPVAHRMERVKLPISFVRGLLQRAGTRIELGDAAMRWAGMPNKNERAALREVLEVLAQSGYVEPAADETWIVRRAAD